MGVFGASSSYRVLIRFPLALRPQASFLVSIHDTAHCLVSDNPRSLLCQHGPSSSPTTQPPSVGSCSTLCCRAWPSVASRTVSTRTLDRMIRVSLTIFWSHRYFDPSTHISAPHQGCRSPKAPDRHDLYRCPAHPRGRARHHPSEE